MERERDSLREDTVLRGCQQEEQALFQQTLSGQLKERLYTAEQVNKEQSARLNKAEQDLREQGLLLLQKDKMCDVIRSQVDMLAKELMSVQSDLIRKEKQLQSKVQKLKE